MSDHLIAKELRAAISAKQDASNLVQAFSDLCIAGKWMEADQTRHQILMLTEASLDAYVRASRLLGKMRDGKEG